MLNYSPEELSLEDALPRLRGEGFPLTSLVLRGNDIGDDGARLIAEALKTNTTLTTLNLECNDIGDDGARLIAEALKTNTTLTTLNLKYNKIDNEELSEINGCIERNKELAKLHERLKELQNKNDIVDILEELGRLIDDTALFHKQHNLLEISRLKTVLTLARDGLVGVSDGNSQELNKKINGILLLKLKPADFLVSDALAFFVIQFAQLSMMDNALALFRHCLNNELAAEALAQLLVVDNTLCSNGFPSKDRYLLIWLLGKNMLLKPENKSLLNCVLLGAITGEKPRDLMFGDTDALVAEMKKLEGENSLTNLLKRAINYLTPIEMSHAEPLSLQSPTASPILTTEETVQGDENSAASQQAPGQPGFFAAQSTNAEANAVQTQEPLNLTPSND